MTTVRLALEARRRLAEIAAAENIDFDREDRGILHFYEKKTDFEAAARCRNCSPRAAWSAGR